MHPSFAPANTLLAGHYERLAEASDRPDAVGLIRAVVTLGVHRVVTRAKGRPGNEAVRYVLSQTATGRQALLIEEITADIQDIAKLRSDNFLHTIPTRHGPLLFLPDVYLESSMPEFKAWQTFLNSLDRSSLLGDDPETGLKGRIPFRAGQWLGDLRFNGGDKKSTIALPESITEVVGDLMIRDHPLDTQHSITVGGTLYADQQQLQEEPSFVDILAGALRLYDEALQSAEALELEPDDLEDWGMGPGSPIHLNDRLSYHLLVEEGPDGPVYALAQTVRGRDLDHKSERHVWDGESWRRFNRDLPPELAYDVKKRFRRICALMGLGEDFITEHKDVAKTLDENTERITLLLALARGEHSRSASDAVPKLSKDRLHSLEKDLNRLRDLVTGRGKEYYRDMESVSQDIAEVLEGMGDNRLKRVSTDLTAHGEPLNRNLIRADREYLAHLATSDTLTFGDILGSAGRALVYLNNLCRSRPARKLAAEAVGRIRKALKEVTDGAGGQTLLLRLLKYNAPADIKALRKRYPDKDDAVTALSKVVNEITDRQPLEVVRDFQMHPYKGLDKELSHDKELLARILSLKKGTLDEVFARPERGHGLDDGRILQNALVIHLQSYVLEEVKARPYDLDADPPSVIIAALQERLDRFRPVLAQFNRLCGLSEN